MADSGYGRLIKDGLWNSNQALVALLGLCPLLAVTNTAVNGLGLGLATTLVLTLSNGTVSLIRNLVRSEIRLPVFVIVIASFVTAVELSMNAWFHELYIGRAEAFASKNNLGRSLVDGLAMGVGFTLVLVTLGGLRELVGLGTLFSQADLMFGEAARGLTINMGEGFKGMLLAILPPGAFIGLGLLIALKNVIDKRVVQSRTAAGTEQLGATPDPAG